VVSAAVSRPRVRRGRSGRVADQVFGLHSQRWCMRSGRTSAACRVRAMPAKHRPPTSTDFHVLAGTSTRLRQRARLDLKRLTARPAAVCLDERGPIKWRTIQTGHRRRHMLMRPVLHPTSPGMTMREWDPMCGRDYVFVTSGLSRSDGPARSCGKRPRRIASDHRRRGRLAMV